MTEAAVEPLLQALIEHGLADVPERRMAKVMAEADRLGQVFVESQRASNGAGNLSHLDRVRKARAVVIALR